MKENRYRTYRHSVWQCLVGLMLLCTATSCSTTKNTGATRAYHGMKVIHNVYFNGNIAYHEGLQAINKANEDDYSGVIPLYPISNESSRQAAISEMDKCIEKCRKCIKLHSIHAKPALDTRRQNDPQYRRWMRSKEFNSQMYRAWLLLAETEFHKGDFLGSIGTFNYVSRLYENDPDIVAQCQLWVARAYGEMGWIYEAEDALKRVQVDNLKREHQPFYSAVNADILLKGKHYQEAIPFVKIARRGEKRSVYKPRFEFVLGQLYELTGQRTAAKAAYKRVLGMQSPHTMDFQARIRYYELHGDTLRTMRRLRQMVKQEKNKDVLDLLYGVMGNLYLANGDTTAALQCYEKGIAASTKSGSDKARILVTAGDLYYDRLAYEQAAPCYEEAVQLLDHNHDAYERVSKRQPILSELVQYTQTIQLQDSLQYLSTLSEEEQMAVANQIIADLRAKEEADSIRQAEQTREQELNSGPSSVNTERLIGGNQDNSWYFYNTELLRKGKQLFQKQWGGRTLEDNWRRRSKAIAATQEPTETASAEANEEDPSSNDTPSSAPVTDVYQPEYYIQQIPHTEADIAASNEQIADALYGLTGVYRDRLDDLGLSRQSLEDYERRFPNDEAVVELYYRQYLSALKLNHEEEAERCKQILLSRFTTSEQTRLVSDPQYVESLRRMAVEQDSVYEQTYKAYRAGRYAEVKLHTRYAQEHFPQTYLMPRFLFLQAVSVARTEGQTAFVERLQELVERYPDHELSAMSKSMLAMMGEGQTAKKGNTAPGSLQDQREAEQARQAEEEAVALQPEEADNRVLITIAKNEDTLNQLLYEVAVFNFSQFLIKDFDLQTLPEYSKEHSALQISGFDKPEEVEWYLNKLQEDAHIVQFFQSIHAQISK